MTPRLALRLTLVCLLTSIATVFSFGQQPATGLPPLGSFAGGPFDTVDLANLDVHFSIPVFSRAGMGIPFSYSLSYDSLVWEPASSGGGTAWQPVNSNWGWRAVTEAATGYVTYGTFTDNDCYYYVGRVQYFGGETVTWGNFVYHDPAGGLHPFAAGAQIVYNYGGSGNNCPSSSYRNITNAVAFDNSGYILSVNVSSGSPVGTVNAHGGITIQVPPIPSSTGAGSVTDANGNRISISSSGVITDTLNTTALTVSGTPSSGTVTYSYSAPYTAYNGVYANVTVSYTQYWVQTCFQVSGIQEFPATAEYLVSEVKLPDGSNYQFNYETTVGCGTSGKVTGRIASVTLPTGGQVSYSYGSTNTMMADGSPSTMNRTLSGGEWQYSLGYQNGSSYPTQTTTTITDPAGNVTNLNFSGIYQTSRTAHEGSSTILDSTITCYDGNTTSCSTATVNQTSYINEQDVYDSPGGGSQTSKLTYLYDQYGNLSTEVDNNYPSGTSVLRKVIVTPYSSLCGSKNICNLPASVQILDGGLVQRALTNYSYDGNGNTTQVSSWTSGSNYLNTGYSYNSNGTLYQATDPNGTATTYT